MEQSEDDKLMSLVERKMSQSIECRDCHEMFVPPSVQLWLQQRCECCEEKRLVEYWRSEKRTAEYWQRLKDKNLEKSYEK
jgi:hypothetical protein